jgi:hypothetical protein
MKQPLCSAELLAIKPGDTVTRWLAGIIPMQLIVSSVTDQRIICGPWEFDRMTGEEIDDDLGWGNGITGSYIGANYEKS